MKDSRRHFVKTSIAFGTLTVTKSVALGGPAVKKKIGYLVSTKDKDKHDNAFQQALSANNWDSSKQQNDPKFANDDYDVTNNPTLKNLAGQHIANNVDLIVAAGGLPTANAVASAVTASVAKGDKTPPFIFLIGRYPKSNAGVDAKAADLYNCSKTYKVGGVDQAMVAQNQANFVKLNKQSKGVVTIGTVGLIVNNNNPITPAETDDWAHVNDPATTGTTNPTFIYPIKDPNNQSQGIANLLTLIRDAKSKPNGIVVSSDPYLREVGNVDFDKQLRDTSTAGGNFQGWVCYPFKEYVLVSAQSMYSDTTPILGDSTNTNSAYYVLGLTAVAILNQIQSNTSPLNAGLTTWDGINKWGNPDYSFP